ncbi:hypothetical protein Ade02nite_31360 [Paractinoplanes deccanensis]|uniref:DUF1996 domain-containing protein n=2 Tax=Paractinoplanes deccanensis TaxID=113561 RepID=A0ABQ3Y3F1_9ACTN|nr:hypothetical protein Ade02nite_31360 [Actinoplanes deccanensis]
MGRPWLAVEAALAVVALGASVAFLAVRGDERDFYTSMSDATRVPVAARPVSGASTGSYAWDCGRNEKGHRNTGNPVVTPGVPGPAHHEHDFVGNLGVRPDSRVDDLVGAPTSCTNGDASTYYWPVLRLGGPDDHHGTALVPSSLTMAYHGNPRGPVVAMPRLLVAAVGDAYAHTNGGGLARSAWSCTNTPGRTTMKYPICDDGAEVVRIFDFPSCWDGRQLDSPTHRQQMVFPAAGGGCPAGTFAVPRLEITMTYAVPAGARYRIDAFDGQRYSPLTDHGFMLNLMPDTLMQRVVGCLNTGRACDDTAGARSG